MRNTPVVTRNYIIRQLVERDGPALDHFIGRALCVLMERQTADEKEDASTKHNNGVGFAGADGKSGTLTAFYYLKHRKLQDWQREKWTRNPNRLAKYHRQLDEAAQAKAAR